MCILSQNIKESITTCKNVCLCDDLVWGDVGRQPLPLGLCCWGPGPILWVHTEGRPVLWVAAEGYHQVKCYWQIKKQEIWPIIKRNISKSEMTNSDSH